jgi:hypothetical protein
MPVRVYLLGVAMVLVGVAFLVTDRLVCQPEPTEANLQRIKPGMTRGQVMAILGPKGAPLAPPRGGLHSWVWFGDTGCAWVHFDSRTGRVQSTYFHSSGPDTQQSPLARLLNWCGW